MASIIFRDGLQISRNVSWSVGVFGVERDLGQLKHSDKRRMKLRSWKEGMRVKDIRGWQFSNNSAILIPRTSSGITNTTRG